MKFSREELEMNIEIARTMASNKRTRYFIKNEIQVPQNSIIVLCGTPGSGKSTLAQNICKKSKNTFRIDLDDFFNEATQKFYPNYHVLYEENLDVIAKEAYKNAFNTAKNLLSKKYTLVWEDMDILPTNRAEVLNELKGLYQQSILVVLKCNLELAITRSIMRGDTQNRTRLIPETYKCLQFQLNEISRFFIGFDKVYIVDGKDELRIKES